MPACRLLFVATLLRITLITDPFSLQSVLVTMHCNAEHGSAPSAAHIQSILPLKPCFFSNKRLNPQPVFLDGVGNYY